MRAWLASAWSAPTPAPPTRACACPDGRPAAAADRRAQPGAKQGADRFGAELGGGGPVDHRLDLLVDVHRALALVRPRTRRTPCPVASSTWTVGPMGWAQDASVHSTRKAVMHERAGMRAARRSPATIRNGGCPAPVRACEGSERDASGILCWLIICGVTLRWPLDGVEIRTSGPPGCRSSRRRADAPPGMERAGTGFC